MFQTHMLMKFCRTLSGIVFAFASLSAAWAASPEPWTTAGSAGSVAPASLPFVQFGNPIPVIVGDTRDVGAITLQPFAFGTFDIRYNVVSVPGILGSPGLTLTVRYLASNPGERVVVSFKQYSLLTGTTTVLGTLDSNSFPVSANFQVQAASFCVPVALDFVNNSYYMEAQLTQSEPSRLFQITPFTHRPALGMIKLDTSSNCTIF
jgi:hypothetical protein